MDNQTFDGMFWLAAGGILAGLFGLACRFCYKCKIQELDLCYHMITIRRDVNAERILDVENKSDDSMPTAGSSGGIGSLQLFNRHMKPPS